MSDVQAAPSDYFIGRDEGPLRSVNRAMVSLGPLSSKRYCTYKCGFCYVDGAFQRYPQRSPAQVVEWLRQRRNDFDIVYVSGDTDSFAPPRTSKGIELLEEIASLDVDLLFTTRYAFTDRTVERIGALAARQSAAGRLFVACISVLSVASVADEPRPVPPPGERLDSLRLLSQHGAEAVLTIRPLLPTATADDMAVLVDACPREVGHVVTGWFYDTREVATARHAVDEVSLYFDVGHAKARVVRNTAAFESLRLACDQADLRLHLGSTNMIESLRVQGASLLKKGSTGDGGPATTPNNG